jgi:hypothetical protein
LNSPRKKICYPVKGSLFVKGKPGEGVLVLLRPKEVGSPNECLRGFPRAVVAADGKFEIETYKEKDGAPSVKDEPARPPFSFCFRPWLLFVRPGRILLADCSRGPGWPFCVSSGAVAILPAAGAS